MCDIPEIPLELKPSTPEAKAAVGFKWAGDGIGKRSKVGGTPDFLHLEEPVHCDGCNSDMTFYAQIDSIGDKVCIADVGMVYVFVCFGCFETKSMIESG